MNNMQAEYPKKQDRRVWDPVHITYPVRKFPTTGESSETIARYWRTPPEVLKNLKEPVEQLQDYLRDYNVTKELTLSQTAKDFGYKIPEANIHYKHSSCLKNEYIYPPSRRLEDGVPQLNAHGTTEMKRSYTAPVTPPRLVTNKDQYKHPASLHLEPLPEPSWHKELEPLDTTYDGFEKYLDPYLTTSRLHHRPFTADQLEKESCSKDIITYYTFANVPWAWGPKPKINEWRLPLSRPKSMYDREKFKQDFREIRTHNKLRWVPGAFHTETRDNYGNQINRPESKIHNYEEDVRSYYQYSAAQLKTNMKQEHATLLHEYNPESRHISNGKPLCSVLDQFKEKNKRLESKNRKFR